MRLTRRTARQQPAAGSTTSAPTASAAAERVDSRSQCGRAVRQEESSLSLTFCAVCGPFQQSPQLLHASTRSQLRRGLGDAGPFGDLLEAESEHVMLNDGVTP